MIDIHPPQHGAMTRRDFFIHLGIVVLGILIAIGLEQTVEHFHQLHQAHHAREMIADEMRQNLKLVRDQRYNLRMHENYLFADLAVIDHMRKHDLAPSDRLILFHPYNTLADSAWQTAKQSQLLALLPYSEVQRDATVYELQEEYTATMSDSTTDLQRANTMRYHSAADRFDGVKANREASASAFYGELGDAAAHTAFESQAPGPVELARFTPAQIDRLEQTIQQSIFADERLINRCSWLEQNYKSLLPNEGSR